VILCCFVLEGGSKLISIRKILITFATLAVLFVLVGLYFDTAVNSSSGGVVTTTEISTIGTTVQSFNPKLGLNFSLTVNATVIPSNESIDVALNVTNVKSLQNQLSASNSWAISGLSTPCDFGYYNFSSSFGVAFFRGDYDSSNISTGTPISVWGAAVECPMDFAGNTTSALGPWLKITSYVLSPDSDNGTESGDYESYQTQNVTSGTFPTVLNFQANIYANDSNSDYGYNSLQSSSTANYTIAAGDEWGQIVLIHFAVISSTIQAPPGIVDIGPD